MDWSTVINNFSYAVDDTAFVRLYALFSEPATSITILFVMITLAYGAINSIVFFEENQQELSEMNNPNTVQSKTAILMPIIGSVMLLVLFYFLNVMIYVLYVMIAFSALMAVMLNSEPVMYKLFHDFPFPEKKEFKVKTCKGKVLIDVYTIFAFLFGLLIIGCWVLFKSWPFVDFMAFCLAVVALSSLRLPSLKIATILLSLFFFYDIFWVFISEYIFGSNVMVTVAVKMISSSSSSLPIPIVIIIPRFFGSNPMLLGLGDIILPGIFLSFLYRFDNHILSLIHKCPNSQVRFMQVIQQGSYFRVGYMGYLFGMLSALIALVTSRMAQPALLYLVPFTIIPTIVTSLVRGEFKMIWSGEINEKDYDLESQLDNDSLQDKSDANPNDTNDEEINLDTLFPNFVPKKSREVFDKHDLDSDEQNEEQITLNTNNNNNNTSDNNDEEPPVDQDNREQNLVNIVFEGNK